MVQYTSTTAKCPKCGSIILWIATKDGPVAVEREEIEILTEMGRRVRGHKEHKCPESNNGGTSSTTGIPRIS